MPDPAEPVAPGRFIVLEGLDGAGTTTQSALLASHLRTAGRTVIETHEPTDGLVGRLIRSALRREPGAVHLDTLPWMFAADRSDHLTRLVQPSVDAGIDVISDRYLHSSLAYQSTQRPFEQIWSLNEHFRVPDLTVFVHISVEVGLSRIQRRGAVREVFEERDRLEAIAVQYERVFERVQGRGDRVVRVDGEASIEDVHRRIVAALGD